MTKSKMTFALLLLFLGCSRAFTQGLTLEKFDREGIYLQQTFLARTYVKNGVEKRVGSFYKNLKPEFEKTPNAKPLFVQSRKQMKRGGSLMLLGLGGLISGMVVAVNSMNINGEITSKSAKNAALGCFWGGLTLSIASIVPTLKGNRNMNRAIWMRNRELME
jgi:hypothetical protein